MCEWEQPIFLKMIDVSSENFVGKSDCDIFHLNESLCFGRKMMR